MKIIIVTIVVLLSKICSYAVNEKDADLLLKEIDKINSFGNEFAFEMVVNSYKDDSLIVGNTLNGFVQINKQHEIKSLLYFTEPNDVKGRKMLIEGKYIWAYFPKTKNLIRLTPLQILVGEVSYGDVLRIIFSDIYDVNKIEEVSELDTSYYRINLVLKKENRGESYYRVNLKVNRKTLRIVYSEMLGSTGKLIKKVFYTEPVKNEGKIINTKITIVDGINAENNSVLIYKKMKRKRIPQGFFNKEYLPRFKNYAN